MFFELGLNGSGVGLMICSQGKSQDSPNLFVTKSLEGAAIDKPKINSDQ